jgi:hypothetical protein
MGFGILKGKKTYVVGALSILGTVAAYLLGDVPLAEAAQLVLTAVLGMTVRNAIK